MTPSLGAPFMLLSLICALPAQGGMLEFVSKTTSLRPFPTLNTVGISADGRHAAFVSQDPNIVPYDTNNHEDVFLHDRETGVTECISVDLQGKPNRFGISYSPSLSQDGRYVVFYSSAIDLVQNDRDAGWDVFLRDRQLGVTTLVSVALNGKSGNAHSETVPFCVSSDARYIAFQSYASDLVPNDTNGTMRDAFVRDMQLGTTTMVSRGWNGQGLDAYATGVTMSADGNWIAYHSRATNIVPNDTNGNNDVFLYDRVGQVTRRVSVGPGGLQANGDSKNASVSSDGTWVIFQSSATNLVPGGSAQRPEVYAYNRFQGFAQRISQHADGAPLNDWSWLQFTGGHVAGDKVLFDTRATDAIPDSSEAEARTVLYDLRRKTFERMAYTPWGRAADVYHGVLSQDGSTGLFLGSDLILPTYPVTNSNLVVYSLYPKIEATSEARLGRPLRFLLTDPRAAGKPYVALTALSYLPAIRVDHRDLFLSADPVLFASLSLPAMFQGYSGQLDAQGQASATLLLPSDPALRGLTLWTAFMTLDASARSGIGAISGSVPTTFWR